MGRRRYAQVEHTADICVHVFGKDMGELFSNAAYAMFDMTYELGRVRESETRRIEVSAPDPEMAMVRLLSELIYLSESGSMVFKGFDVKCTRSKKGLKVVCKATGERFDASRHERRALIKAVSYYSLEIDEERGMANIVFDT